MTHKYDEELAQNAKRNIRRFTDAETLDSFTLFGLKIVEMDRAELLGAICFLAKHGNVLLSMQAVKGFTAPSSGGN